MSCIHCAGKKGNEVSYPCMCDSFTHPEPLSISAGLKKLPRQIATFPQFRKAMLHALKNSEIKYLNASNTLVNIKPLSKWNGRDKDDLGIMLLEMWAYICDAVSFYDEVIANETYVRTSYLRPSLRKLVALLGYLPRPAVGSSAYLAAIAQGRMEVRLPAGTAFRSGGFNGNPPQVFELEDDISIHPLVNRFPIKLPRRGRTFNNSNHFLINPLGEIKEDMSLLLINKAEGSCQVLSVNSIEKYSGEDLQQYDKLNFTSPQTIADDIPLANLRLLSPSQLAKLCAAGKGPDPIDGSNITLNILANDIKAGDYIIIASLNEKRWFRVIAVSETNLQQVPAGNIKINDSDFSIPGVTVPVTQLSLDVSVNAGERRLPNPAWNVSMASQLTVYFGFQTVATITDELSTLLAPGDPIDIDGIVEKPVPSYDPSHFILVDKNASGVDITGTFSFNQKSIEINHGVSWNPELVLPVDAYGNIIKVNRGETVENEKLGTGDASSSNQTFKLKKKPLTYFMSSEAGNDQMVKNTLTVYINGIRWKEVKSFFGQKKDSKVYIVRQDDKAESFVTFGDGIRGERLPSGASVIGNYRFGAEAACPPGGVINQISKPAQGLQSAKNYFPAFGGADAESEEGLRNNAPGSALILGRVVSIKDMEAMAAGFPGVRAVQSEWRWDGASQRTAAHLYYIGDSQVAVPLSRAIRNASDPSTPITIENAIAKPLNLSLSILIDSRYIEQDVLREVRNALVNIQTGMLAPENIGISQPLYRSQIFDAVLKTPGTQSVNGIFIGPGSFNEFAVVPGTGYYFDIEHGSLIINGKDN